MACSDLKIVDVNKLRAQLMQRSLEANLEGKGDWIGNPLVVKQKMQKILG